MAISIISGFDVTSAQPADLKSILASSSSLTSISSSWRYDGMKVYCQTEREEWQLMGGVSDFNWVLLTISGSQASASYALTASYVNGGSGGTTVSCSWASQSLSSSVSVSSSYAMMADTASYFFTSSVTSASYALTASYASNVPLTASNALTASSLIGWNFTNTSSNVNVVSSNIPVVDVPTGSYNAAFFDYVALSGSNCRAGTVFGSWVNGFINYTEVSNVDVGDTSKVTMSMALNGGDVQLLANVTDTTPWQIKALGRYL